MQQSDRPDLQSSHEILNQLVKLAPLIKKTIPLNCLVGVTDREKFLYAFPFDGPDNIPDFAGMPIPDGDAIKEAMEQKVTLMQTVDSAAFGIAFKANGTPIFDEEGNVIGGFGIGISLDNQQKLNEMAQKLAAMSEQIAASSEEMSSSAQNLSGIMGTLSSVQHEMKEQFRDTDQILNLIHSVAETTKLLGLNAAIEAARAGEHGRGFAVVAHEIRKLADDSSASVLQIRKLLGAMNEKVERLQETIEHVTQIAHQQSSTSQEVSASIQELTASAYDLESVAKIL